MTNEYLFPEIYVENIHSHRYLCISENGDAHVIDITNAAPTCKRVFGLIPYEQVLDYIDLERAKTNASISIIRLNTEKDIYEGVLLERDTKLCLQEITGSYVFVAHREGDIIHENTRIAYIVTNKLEVRNIRSRCNGLIAFLVDKPWEEPRVLILVTTNEYRSITARKAS